MKEYTDIALINGCKKGNSEYQHSLFMQYSERLFSTALRYMGNEADAKDVLQESFFRILKYIKNVDPSKGSLKNWMTKICINEALKKLKSRGVNYDIESVVQISTSFDIEEKISYEETYTLISSLKLPYRTVVNLYWVEGYSHKEIAEKLNIKESSSRSILARAKKILQKNSGIQQKRKEWII